MDKILLRPMFRQRYLKEYKISKFKEGGIAQIPKFKTGGLSSQEKAMYAATFAAPLLQATRRQGEGVLPGIGRAFGQGLEQVPATILAVEKAKGSGKGNVRTLTAEEIKAYNLPPGTFAQMKPDGTVSVVSKAGAEQMKTMQGSKRVRSILARIAGDYQDLGKPVGFADVNRIGAFFGRATGSEYAKRYQGFKSRIQAATSFVTQAISGAAVSEQEAERIKQLIPQVGDRETVFEGKLSALDQYFNDAIQIAQNNNADFMTAMEIMEKQGQGAGTYLDLTEEVIVEPYGDGGYDVTAN